MKQPFTAEELWDMPEMPGGLSNVLWRTPDQVRIPDALLDAEDILTGNSPEIARWDEY